MYEAAILKYLSDHTIARNEQIQIFSLVFEGVTVTDEISFSV